MNQVTKIDLIRHGEPVGGRRYRGQVDDPLSEKGWSQMRKAVGDSCPWDTIVSSPLRRCMAFAEELARRHGLPLSLDERLMEIGFGEWEGRTAEEITASDPEVIMRFYADPVNNRPDGAEPLTDFEVRVGAAIDTILASHPGDRILVVAHAGTIRMILRQVLGMPLENLFRIHVPNAAITRLEFHPDHNGWFARLLSHAGACV